MLLRVSSVKVAMYGKRTILVLQQARVDCRLRFIHVEPSGEDLARLQGFNKRRFVDDLAS